MQILFHLPTFQETIRNISKVNLLYSDMKTLFNIMNSEQHHGNVKYLLRTLSKTRKDYANNDQKDSPEFLEHLLEDLNTGAVSLPNPDVFTNLFRSVMSEEETCQKCNHVSHAVNYNWMIHLDITVGTCLEEILTKYLTPFPTPTKSCGTCGTQQPHMAALEFQHVPPILLLHLGRFADNGDKSSKFIDIPLTMKLEDASGCAHQFALRGIIDQIGTAGAGHYVARCWRSNPGAWFLLDDTCVSPTSIRELVTPDSYVLSYEKVH
jgi:ubiquitin C-terminal hydrolase